ncbi:MAG: TIGR04290 family methyltransferase [Phycisphaerae bacterium]
MIDRLGPWFHNIHLPGGEQTAPDHWLGDFPRFKWEQIAPHLPEDLTGRKVLDIGCNAGFYSIQLARRGAEVLGIDHDDRYLKQARWEAGQFDLSGSVEFRRMPVYRLIDLAEQFDVVIFMGVLYHLRYPLLALDIVSGLVGEMMVFQTFTVGHEETADTPEDFSFADREQMNDPTWPRMAFIEKRMENDPTNWWAPSHACVLAMLRSAGMAVTAQPGHEIYICRPDASLIDFPEMRQEQINSATGGRPGKKQ